MLIKEHGEPCVSTALSSQIHTQWYLGMVVMEQICRVCHWEREAETSPAQQSQAAAEGGKLH